MKKYAILLLMITVLALCAAASAAPALTDGDVTAWIGADQALYIRKADGVTHRLETSVDDLLSMDSDMLYLVDHSRRLLAVRRDGSRGQVLMNAPTAADLDAKREARFTLQGGILSAGGRQLSATATAAASDGTWVCWAEMTDAGWRLGQASANPAVPETNNAVLNGRSIPEPLSLTMTEGALTLTAADHSVLCFSLSDGHSVAYAADNYLTAAAALADGDLLRYTAAANGAWVAETENSQPIPMVTPENTNDPLNPYSPAPTAVWTPVPTPTPYNTPVPTPTSTPDDRIHKGDSGSMVRSIQKRLDELGYPVGKIDGVYGNDTQTALNLFMDAIHVTEHNYVTPAVRRRLFASSAPVYDPYMQLKKGNSGEAVLRMQERLQELGYDPQKIDGKYGELTVKAVEKFQEAAGLEVDGDTASRKMLKRLYSSDAPAKKVVVSGGVYRLSDSSATLTGTASRSIRSLTIPSTVQANGREYPVTTIDKRACRGLTSLEKVTIGSRVKKIGKEAFAGCTRMKKIHVKTSQLTDEKMGEDVFDGIPKDAVVTCPEAQEKAYKSLFRSRGLSKKVKFNP